MAHLASIVLNLAAVGFVGAGVAAVTIPDPPGVTCQLYGSMIFNPTLGISELVVYCKGLCSDDAYKCKGTYDYQSGGGWIQSCQCKDENGNPSETDPPCKARAAWSQSTGNWPLECPVENCGATLNPKYCHPQTIPASPNEARLCDCQPPPAPPL